MEATYRVVIIPHIYDPCSKSHSFSLTLLTQNDIGTGGETKFIPLYRDLRWCPLDLRSAIKEIYHKNPVWHIVNT